MRVQPTWRPFNRRGWIPAGYIVLVFQLHGCAQKPLPSEDIETAIILPLTPVSAESICPLVEGEWRYAEKNRAGTETGEEFVIRRTPTTEFNAEWKDDRNSERTQYWRRDEVGNIVMTASIEHADDALALFDPPLVIAPSHLWSNGPYEQSVSMRVVRASNPEVQRTSGTCTRSMRYVGDEMIPCGGVDVLTHRIEITFRADLSLATSETTSILWMRPGNGMAAEESSELTKALGVFGAEEFTRLELIEDPD